MSSFCRLSNKKCYKQNQSPYKQCDVLKDGRVISSCSNTYGIDGWPASVPQQSNFRFTNGISGHKPPNGYQRYLQPVYLYNGIVYKPHHKFIYNSNLSLKTGKTYFTQNDIKYVLVEDLLTSQFKLFNILQNGLVKKFS